MGLVRSGRNAASRPIIGRNAHSWYGLDTDNVGELAQHGGSDPAIPNAKPKNTPEMSPRGLEPIPVRKPRWLKTRRRG